jgi:formamidopyrimidine-DNA glycosylase
LPVGDPVIMPELPEVEQARRYLEENALNRRIRAVEVLDGGVLRDISTEEFRKNVAGHMMVDAGRQGKQLFLGLDDRSFLTIHLGMTGDLVMADVPTPRYARIIFRFEDGTSLYYTDQRKFGAIGIVGSLDQFVSEHALGPDALCIDRSDFVERVSGHKKAIKSVLLDQSVLAGIGNLYADEVLFQARLHPLTRADSISLRKLGELYQQVGNVLRCSIAVSSDFSALPDRYLLKVRKEGAACPRGNGRLAMVKVGGRTAIYCPVCQQLR